MNTSCGRWILCALVASAISSDLLADQRFTNADRTSNTVQLLEYQAEGYTYRVIGRDAIPPRGFEQPDFDDSKFETGQAAFGGGGGGLGNGRDCPLLSGRNTNWRLNSQLLVRKSVFIPGGAANPRLLLSVDNDVVDVFLNGHSIASGLVHDGCPIEDEIRVDLPDHLIRFDDVNVLAFRLVDRGVESFFDASVLAQVNRRVLRKVVEDFLLTVDERTPEIASISALTIDECEPPMPDGTTLVRARYKVNETGSDGEVRVSAKRGQVSVQHMTDGKETHTTTQGPRRGQVVVAPDGVPRRAASRVEIANAAAPPVVLSRGRMLAAVTKCIAANDHIVNPGASCRENVTVAEDSCNLICTQEESAAAVRCGNNTGSLFCALTRLAAKSKAEECLRECARAGTTLRRAC